LNDSDILSINPPFWTLAVEMQFYLLLPLLFLALRPLSSSVSFALVLVLCIGAYLANYELNAYLLALNHWPLNLPLIWPFAIGISGPDSFVLTYSTLGHLTFFLTGIGAAWLFLQSGGLAVSQKPGFNADIFFWVSAVTLAVILSTPLDDVLQLPFGHYNWPIGPLLLAVMVFTAPRARTARAILDHGPIRWLGLVSYGVYIFHYPVLRVMQTAMGAVHLGLTEYWLIFVGISFAGTIVIASASYRLLETPIMQLARRRRPVQRDMVPLRPRPARPHLKSAGWAEVPIGLRSEQVRYLEDVSADRARSLSSATRHVIAEFITRLSEEADDRPLGLGLALPQDTARDGHKGREHQHIVNLPNDYVEFLSGLSDKLGTTMSRTVQMIVDDFMVEHAHRGKPQS
jgi:peptidoglycan/LPS O-acetylase OafA/YrhL